MIGGRSYWESKWNRATQAERQPGSAFKAFVYTAAIEAGIGPSTIILDEPLVVPMPNGDVYKPENQKRNFRGPLTLREAMSKSVNVPAVRMILTVGPEAAVDVAHRCGISTNVRPYPSTALGASEVKLIDLAAAYTVFPNLGVYHEPWSIREVRDRNDIVLETGEVHSREALAAPVAGVMVNLFEEVMNTGTGASSRWKGITCPAGGKTGTMDDYTDALFVGFTPLYTMAVWVGFDLKQTLGRNMTGASAALPIWIETMKEILKGKQSSLPPFEVPDGIVTARVCKESGVLAVDGCTDTYREVFLEDHVPTEPCPLHSGDRITDPWTVDLDFDRLDRRETAEERDLRP
jgi:penicillin-binding protein 1A